MNTRFPRPLLYFFYRTLRLRVSRRGYAGTPVFDCAGVVCALVGINLITICGLLKQRFDLDPLWFIERMSRLEQRAIFFAMILVLYSAIYCYVVASPQRRVMEELFDKESDEARRRGTVGCLAYAVLSFVAPLVLSLFRPGR